METRPGTAYTSLRDNSDPAKRRVITGRLFRWDRTVGRETFLQHCLKDEATKTTMLRFIDVDGSATTIATRASGALDFFNEIGVVKWVVYANKIDPAITETLHRHLLAKRLTCSYTFEPGDMIKGKRENVVISIKKLVSVDLRVRTPRTQLTTANLERATARSQTERRG